jgi:AraC family transcriptional regulator of arabinose operon
MDKTAVMHGRIHVAQGPTQTDPLFPGYPFDQHLVAGITPITQGGPLDFRIDRPHGMKGFILNMTVRGTGDVFDGQQSSLCEPGDLLLFAPEARHDYGRAEGHGEWFHRWVYFRPRGFWSAWLQWPETAQHIGRLHLRTDALRAEFEALFTRVEHCHRGGRPTSQELAINQLEHLLIRCIEEAPAEASRPVDTRVQAACQFIARHLAQDLGLEEIAREVCLSPSRLAQLFREQIGVSIVRWREDQRLILAKHLLRSSSTAICSVSSLVGYEDQLYFSRVFRKRLGVSPSEYRKSPPVG